MGEWTSGTDEGGEIGLFAIGPSILPAAPDDALPLVGQSAHGGMERTTFGALLLEVSSGPLVVANTLTRILMKALAHEKCAGEATFDQPLAAALAGDGRDGAGALQGAG